MKLENIIKKSFIPLLAFSLNCGTSVNMSTPENTVETVYKFIKNNKNPLKYVGYNESHGSYNYLYDDKLSIERAKIKPDESSIRYLKQRLGNSIKIFDGDIKKFLVGSIDCCPAQVELNFEKDKEVWEIGFHLQKEKDEKYHVILITSQGRTNVQY